VRVLVPGPYLSPTYLVLSWRCTPPCSPIPSVRYSVFAAPPSAFRFATPPVACRVLH
jgi:hypothetical protein